MLFREFTDKRHIQNLTEKETLIYGEKLIEGSERKCVKCNSELKKSVKTISSGAMMWGINTCEDFDEDTDGEETYAFRCTSCSSEYNVTIKDEKVIYVNEVIIV